MALSLSTFAFRDIDHDHLDRWPPLPYHVCNQVFEPKRRAVSVRTLRFKMDWRWHALWAGLIPDEPGVAVRDKQMGDVRHSENRFGRLVAECRRECLIDKEGRPLPVNQDPLNRALNQCSISGVVLQWLLLSVRFWYHVSPLNFIPPNSIVGTELQRSLVIMDWFIYRTDKYRRRGLS